jgi:hypothetical protein
MLLPLKALSMMSYVIACLLFFNDMGPLRLQDCIKIQDA